MTKRSMFSVAHLRTHTNEFVDAVYRSGGPLYITDEGLGKVVMLDIASFQLLEQAVVLLRDIADSEQDGHLANRTNINAFLKQLDAESKDA
jgi:prevent-host-death family protein